MAAPARHMLTANRLLDGDVVYWRAGGWVEAFAQGEVFDSEADAAAGLEAAKAFVSGNVVVNPYLFDVRDDNGVTVPVKEREIVRAAGPSIRRDLGKQAEGLSPAPPVHPAETILAAPVKKTDNVSI